MKKNTSSRIFLMLLVLSIMFLLTACGKTQLTPSVSFGFKNTDSASSYNESLTSFEVGKKFYTCITLRLVTNKKGSENYKVVVEVPKTKVIEVKGMGGLNPDTNNYITSQQLSRLTYTIKGYKEATPEKLLFYGTPTDEGEAVISIHIYDKDGNEVNKGYTRKIFFEYTLD